MKGIWIGIALGLVVAALLPFWGSAPAAPGVLLPDRGGAVREYVIQYLAEAADIVADAYRDFLTQLPPNRTVHVVCPAEHDFEDLVTRVGETACLLEPVYVRHPMTPWSRDRWIALAGENDSVRLLVSKAEDGEENWPARSGDRRMAEDLAASTSGVDWIREGIRFDGGDFVADPETAFVAGRILARNRGWETDEFVSRLEDLLGRAVVLLEDAPDHHAGMYVMPAGAGTVLVGQASDGPPEVARRLDSVADDCREAGYRVVRMPVMPVEGRAWRTPLNVILDEEAGKPIVYMPVFEDAPELNDEAERIWSELGHEVRRVDCTRTWRHSGSLRCLVNVLRR